MKRSTVIVLDDLQDLTPQIITIRHKPLRNPDNEQITNYESVNEPLPELKLPKEISERLFEHQRVGVN